MIALAAGIGQGRDGLSFTLFLFGFCSTLRNWMWDTWAGGALTTSGLDTTGGGAGDRLLQLLASYPSWCWNRWK